MLLFVLWPGVRPSTPTDISAIKESNGISVTWREPLDSAVPIFNYVVEHKIGDSDWMQSDYLRLPTTSYLFTDTTGGEKHYFRVYSYGILAFSAASDTVSVDIPKGKINH